MATGPAQKSPLAHLRVLVLEDDYLLANDVATWLVSAGAVVLGPAATISAAHTIIDGEKIDFALLDINIDGSATFEVPARLDALGAPYVFTTGYEAIPSNFAHIPTLKKPFGLESLLGLVSEFPDQWRPSAGEWRPKNRLLASLPKQILRELKPHMTLAPLNRHKVIARQFADLERVYFPETGICSLLLGPPDAPVEVGVVGNDGAIGASESDAPGPYPFHVFVQTPGFAIAMGLEPFRRAVSGSAASHDVLRRYSHAFLMQVSYSAASNATQTVEERLARWLLMCADRVGDELKIVHEHIALMLNVRRAGVTTSMHALEEKKAIHSERGSVTILDRDALSKIAGWTYGAAEAEYARLFQRKTQERELTKEVQERVDL